MSKVKYLHYDRHLGIGGSDANVIMKGEWKNLWEIKTQRKEADNLDDVLPVQIGTITEKLNCRWLAKSIGSTVEDYHQEYVKKDFMLAHFDGWIEDENALVECKHTHHHNEMCHVKKRYYPQLQHYLYVGGFDYAYLSVIFGNNRHEHEVVEYDREYIEELIQTEGSFWDCVINDIEPEF